MDQDDIAHPTRFETQLNYLISSGADIAGTWVKRFGAADNRTVRLPQSDAAIKIALLFESPFAHPTVMMKAESIKKLGYEHTWDKAEDYDLWVRAAISGWKMANVPEVLLDYRVHASQISTSSAVQQMSLSQGIREKYWNHSLTQWGVDTSCIESVLSTYVPYSKVNLEKVDIAIGHALQHSEGESRAIVFNNAYKIYIRVAANQKNVISHWKNLCTTYSLTTPRSKLIALWIFRNFRIHPEGKIFNWIRTALNYVSFR
ncbi:glycosyl transferase family 2 [Pseudomonas sp. FH1]|nr:glycosyl transferase family 2 [Pseudomonas sp. FH1]